MSYINMTGVCILIFCLIGGAQSVCHTELTQIRTNTIAPIIMLTDSTTSTSFTATFSSSLPANSTYTWGLGLIGYQSYLTGYFCFNVTGNVFINALGVTINICETTYISMLKFRYIATSLTKTTASTKMHLRTGCYKCIQINQINSGFGARSQSIFDNQTNSAIASFKIQSFIFSFNVTNKVGSANYFKVTTAFTSNKFKHTIYTSQNMTVEYVCLTMIAWDNSTDIPGTSISAFMDSYTLDSTNLTSNTYKYMGFQCNNMGFYGLTMINHDMGGTRLLQFKPGDNTTTTFTINKNEYFVSAIIQIFYVADTICTGVSPYYDIMIRQCLSNCTNALTPINSASNNTCVGCPKYCVTCSNQSTCIQCLNTTNRNGSTCTCAVGYFDYQGTSQVCDLCSTYISYCLSCTNDTTEVQGVRCTDCGSTRFLYNNLCQCANRAPNNTFEVSNLCLAFPGCLNATGNNNVPYCTTCNIAGNFVQNIINCSCQTGFTYNIYQNYSACQPTCGTGYIGSSSNASKCDDNNTNQVDGCFNNCTVMPGWVCSVTAGTTGPSFCVLTSTISFTYIYSKKVQGLNQAQIYLQVSSPTAIPSNLFTQTQIGTNITFDSITISYDSSSGRLKILVTYSQDMQANNYQFTFTFPVNKTISFYSLPVQTTATTIGINQALIVSNYSTILLSINYLIMILSFGGIILSLLSSIFGQKLIALQLILPIQATYFMYFTIQKLPMYFNQYKTFAYSNGFNQIQKYNYEKYLGLDTKLVKYDYQVQFLLNFNVSSGILVASFLVFMILQLVYYCKNYKLTKMQLKNVNQLDQNQKDANIKPLKPQKISKQQQKLKSTPTQQQSQYALTVKQSKQNIKKYLNNYYFFITILLAQSCFFAFIIQNSQQKVSYMLISININTIIAYIDIIMIIGMITFMISELFDKKDKRMLYFVDVRTMKYPVLMICCYVIIAIVSGLSNGYRYSPYIVVGLSTLPLLLFLYFRPYTQFIFLNTLGAILTQSLPIVSSIIYLFLQINQPPEMLLLIFSITIVSYIMLLEMYTVFRFLKIIDWSDFSACKKCTKKKVQHKHKEGELLDNVQQVEMSAMIKENMMKQNDGLNWQSRNKKDYQSVVKPEKQEESGHQKSQNNKDQEEENNLIQFKKKLRKQLEKKRGFGRA